MSENQSPEQLVSTAELQAMLAKQLGAATAEISGALRNELQPVVKRMAEVEAEMAAVKESMEAFKASNPVNVQEQLDGLKAKIEDVAKRPAAQGQDEAKTPFYKDMMFMTQLGMFVGTMVGVSVNWHITRNTKEAAAE